MKKNTIFLLFSFVILFISCEEHPSIEQKDEVERSIYIWKAISTFTEKDNIFFKENNITKLYIRFFDVAWDNIHGEIPLSELQCRGLDYDSIEIIPVIYIKNEVFQNIEAKNLEDFSDKIHFKIEQIFIKNSIEKEYNEIQIDCDWTESTKDKYFEFLNILMTKFTKKQLSVTIRLHQIKFKDETGIPPADKGVLMYYNMGDIAKPQEGNSILYNEIGKLYISEDQEYPLELSLALPIFSWGIWLKEEYNGSDYEYVFHKLLYSINSKNINSLDFLKQETKDIYWIKKDTVYDGNYFRYGQKIKLEQVSLSELIAAIKICKPLINNEIILFSYSPENSVLLNKDTLNKIYRIKNEK